ncbi:MULTISPECIES: helix-turn-helix transcriptional regulator [Thiothrix]|uniref:YafY family protein n=1 Tax=Thiothrix lacustris TaxID=525917 RepID=A0ABY9MM22_9GAMM|nr:YafY family protein [Thiothrix lacustris]WML89301.1 YafY family protein [Thiothrix lacustris]WMP15936.1 YafY family protein [Thiothrix lacustris]
MRRADRLFQLVQILRNKRLVTARELADRLEVSERTIYRDMQDLSLSGVPVEGEAGVGYHLRYSLDIPPLMFSAAEIEALVVGARMLKAWGGSELGSSAQSVLDKVHAVIPAELHHHLEASRLYAMRFGAREDLETTLDTCRHAIAARRLLRLDYQRADDAASQREVKPLGLFFWGNVWTLTAWCELRHDFRTFRLDRIRQLETLAQTFEELPGQRLSDFVTLMQSGCEDF